jgi:hypothetical protein
VRALLRRPIRAFAALVLLAATGAGCAPSQRPRLLWNESESADGSVRVVVAPLNLALRLDPDLESALPAVDEEIVRYFQSHGARVAVIWPPDATTLWREAVAAVRGAGPEPPDLERAAAEFSLALGDHADFDLLALPSLVYREAKLVGRYAQWDGVRRKVTVHTATRVGGRSVAMGWEGMISAVSLHTLVVTRHGQLVYQGFGGLDVVHDAVVPEPGRTHRAFLRPQPEALGNTRHVREGVARALDPYVSHSP